MFPQGGVYIYLYISIYITQTPHKLNMENSITQVLLNGSMPNFAEVLYTVRTLFTQTLVEFGPIGQFLLGSLFSKWDLKVGISVSWQGFFIFMLRIRVGGLPCGLARPLIYIYIYIYMGIFFLILTLLRKNKMRCLIILFYEISTEECIF